MTFKIAMLTYGHPHSVRVLQGLKRAGIEIQAVVFETRPHLRDNLASSSSGMSFITRYLAAIRSWLGYRYRCLRVNKTYASLAERVVFSGPLNSVQMVDDLHKLAPDFLLLGGSGIVKDPVIETARRGVLNTHPGLLPWIRGTGVVGRALERRIPVGATAHYVNSGIDRGAIIERRLLPLTGTEVGLKELEFASENLISRMMVDLIADTVSSGQIPVAVEQNEKYPLCKKITDAERKVLDEQIQRGVARELFEKWKPYCIEQEKFQLPSDFTGLNDFTVTH
jgi:folate-dependent phosphoribosylglycinamide formyltransferase PurN